MESDSSEEECPFTCTFPFNSNTLQHGPQHSLHLRPYRGLCLSVESLPYIITEPNMERCDHERNNCE